MEKFDLAIIGAGPAGVSAGIYAARKQIKTIHYAVSFGGQSVVSTDIQNWVGEISITGVELAKKLRKHLESYQSENFKLMPGIKVELLSRSGDGNYIIKDEKGEEVEVRSVLIATGADRRKLPESVEGADEYEHKGVTYCASCDGPFFADKDVVVVGGGNAGFETAAQLLAYTKSVTLLHRNSSYKADAITVEKVLSHPKMTGILDSQIKAVRGDGKCVTEVEYEVDGELKKIPAQGVFVEIGVLPNTHFVEDGLVELDEFKRIKKDPLTQRTSVAGIWAVGDATNSLYHQNNVAAGEGVVAIENIYLYLNSQ